MPWLYTSIEVFKQQFSKRSLWNNCNNCYKLFHFLWLTTLWIIPLTHQYAESCQHHLIFSSPEHQYRRNDLFSRTVTLRAKEGLDHIITKPEMIQSEYLTGPIYINYMKLKLRIQFAYTYTDIYYLDRCPISELIAIVWRIFELI